MKRQRPEQIIHQAIVAHLRARLPAGWLYWHTPNGGRRGRVEGAIFKALGVRAGIPDLFVYGEGRLYGIEVKAPGGSLTPAQHETIDALVKQGCPVIVAKSADFAMDGLKALGVPLRGRAM